MDAGVSSAMAVGRGVIGAALQTSGAGVLLTAVGADGARSAQPVSQQQADSKLLLCCSDAAVWQAGAAAALIAGQEAHNAQAGVPKGNASSKTSNR